MQPVEPVEDRFERIVFKALEKEPENRFSSALELKEDLLASCLELAQERDAVRK